MSAEKAKTGNALLDVWLDALTPFVPGNAASQSPLAWERMFFADSQGSPVGPSAFGSAAAANMAEVWSDLVQRSLGGLAALGKTSSAGDPLGEALEASFGVMGDVGGTVLEGPALLAEATKAASVLCAAREAYRAFMFATWQRALGEVSREAARRASEGKPVVTPAQWLSFSNAVADRVFVEAFNSQPYIDAQRRLSSALADQRRSEIRLVESFARFGHFPTRQALDALGEEVNELRRRVRRLERASRGAAPRPRKAKADDAR